MIEQDTRIKLLRKTTQWFQQYDPILLEGELACDYTNGTLKIGDGTSHYSELDSLGYSKSEIDTMIEEISQTGITFQYNDNTFEVDATNRFSLKGFSDNANANKVLYARLNALTQKLEIGYATVNMEVDGIRRADYFTIAQNTNGLLLDYTSFDTAKAGIIFNYDSNVEGKFTDNLYIGNGQGTSTLSDKSTLGNLYVNKVTANSFIGNLTGTATSATSASQAAELVYTPCSTDLNNDIEKPLYYADTAAAGSIANNPFGSSSSGITVCNLFINTDRTQGYQIVRGFSTAGQPLISQRYFDTSSASPVFYDWYSFIDTSQPFPLANSANSTPVLKAPDDSTEVTIQFANTSFKIDASGKISIPYSLNQFSIELKNDNTPDDTKEFKFTSEGHIVLPSGVELY